MKHIYLVMTAVITASLSSMALASPVSLNCQVVSGKDGIKTELVIQLNEETESATYTLKTGETVRWKAIFTATKVFFGQGAFIIDRETMAFTRHRLFAGENTGTDIGTCALSTIKKVF